MAAAIEAGVACSQHGRINCCIAGPAGGVLDLLLRHNQVSFAAAQSFLACLVACDLTV